MYLILRLWSYSEMAVVCFLYMLECFEQEVLLLACVIIIHLSVKLGGVYEPSLHHLHLHRLHLLLHRVILGLT